MVRTTTVDLDDARVEWAGWVPSLVIEEHRNGNIVKRSRVSFPSPCMIAHLRETLRSVADVMRKAAETL